MKVLVVGANSILAQRLIKLILQENIYTITGVYNKNKNYLLEKIHYLSVEKIWDTLADYSCIYIVAAHVPYTSDNSTNQKLFESNIQLVEKIVTNGRHAKIIFCSSVSVYGNKPQNPITEDSSLHPDTPYAKAKLAGEMIVSLAPHYNIVRFSSIYADHLNNNTLIPRMFHQLKANNEVVLWGDGSRMQNYIHVDDGAFYLKKCLQYVGNEVFLATSKQSLSNLKVAEMVCSNFKKARITFTGEDHSPSFHYDNTETRRKLGIEQDKNFEESIRQMMHLL